MLASDALGDVDQLLFSDFESSRCWIITGVSVRQFQRITQESYAGLGLLAEVVDGLCWHDDLGGEGHPVGVASPGVMKETAHIGVATVLVAHGGNCLHQGVAG